MKANGSESIQNNPRVSLVIPTYNSEETLPECLRSAHLQTYAYHEVIVVDNFSNDRTLEIAKEFGVKIIREKCNPALARNIGVANSNSKYIMFMDSDQTLSNSVITECVSVCEAGSVGMVRIPEVFLGRSCWGACSAAWKNCYEKVEQKKRGGNILAGEPRFFTREQLLQAGMFNTALLWGENYNLYGKLKQMSVREATCKSRIYHYEPSSIRAILVKILQYGESIPVFMRQDQNSALFLIIRHSLLALTELIREYGRYPNIVIGGMLLLGLKAYSLSLGLLAGVMHR